jgi:signal transduction histidine kinase
MTPSYDVVLVLMSFTIAVLASYVALDMTERVTRSDGRARLLWWLGGAAAMGVGIWSMHFVGMLALQLPVAMQYDAPKVVLSVLVAIAASALALHVASRRVLPIGVLTRSSLLMGAAISGMHYIGMWAMELPATVTWRPWFIVASVVIAVVASFAALTLAFRLRQEHGPLFQWMKLGAACVMGLAIVGMHYTGMAAAQFGPPLAADIAGGMVMQSRGLSFAVIAGTALILGLALARAAVDERERLLEREQRARIEVEASNRLKDEFMATLSHELRTPLNVILGRTQMLRSAASDAERVRQLTEMIDRNASALAKLVEDLLDVSRITLGYVRLECQPVRLSEVLAVSVQAIQPSAHAKEISLSVNATDEGLISADAARLQQIIWNLLTNAIKFTPDRGRVEASVGRRSNRIVLTISDTGCGIEPGFLPHIFEPFRQAEPMMTRTHGGLGIGLSIVRHLVELHGGTIAVHSAGTGRGSTFTVQLPSERVPVPAPARLVRQAPSA